MLQSMPKLLICLSALGLLSLPLWLYSTGCHGGSGAALGEPVVGIYPPAPQKPRIVALGTLRGAQPPSKSETDLSRFLFGAEPPPPLTIAHPVCVSSAQGIVLICDATLGTVFRWDQAAGKLSELRFNPPITHPRAVSQLPDGRQIISEPNAVRLCNADGQLIRRYTIDQPFRVSAALLLDDEIWVSNIGANRLDVFDANTAQHRRAVGGANTEIGELALPRGLAITPAGNIAVVDSLHCRVRVVSPEGRWVRDIGQPGNSTGTFGRPKGIAIGPDGATFVTDAFSQRVHVFDADGNPLLAFGEPGSGTGALALPNGVAVSTVAPPTEHAIALEEEPDYYILVAEQLRNPGIRVYAWLGGEQPVPTVMPPPEPEEEWQPAFPQSAAINPHWHPDRCDVCHERDGDRWLPIPPEAGDRLCVSCHDGVRAPADPHPIGRPADTDLVKTPDSWPTVHGAIGCMTCHDIQRHCDVDAKRPPVNTVLLRGYDPEHQLDYCTICHRTDISGRFSPHQQRDATGRVRDDACFFCHTRRPEMTEDGRRQFEPHLRVESSELCLNCHSPHWDLSLKGHVDRPVTTAIRQWMLIRELSLDIDASPAELAEIVADYDRPPARIPLGNGKVTCYTCHNPHYAGLFPEGSELGALADNPADRAAALRTNWIDLCSECHHH